MLGKLQEKLGKLLEACSKERSAPVTDDSEPLEHRLRAIFTDDWALHNYRQELPYTRRPADQYQSIASFPKPKRK